MSAQVISDVKYGLGSKWESFPQGAQRFSLRSGSGSLLFQTAPETPAPPPIGSTLFLLGLSGAEESPEEFEAGGRGGLGLSALLLHDAPEGGVCKPAASV